jgi:hypothetical protein
MSDLAVEPIQKAKAKISASEMQRRRDGLRQAKAHSRIEGQYPSPEGEAIFDAFVRGEIECDEMLPRLHALHRRP